MRNEVFRSIIKIAPVAVIFGFVFTNLAPAAYATSDPSAIIDTLSVTVDSNCQISQSGSGTYTKTINPGNSDSITANTITAVCNDSGGYAIYAVGYSGDSLTGNNTDLISSDNANWNIKTDGSFADSYWKLLFTASGQASVTSPYTTYQQIPSSHAKIASYEQYATSGSIVPHYQISLGQGQPAGTYIGKVQYVLVSSSSDTTPFNGLTMQNLSGSACTSTPTQARDTRDNHVYTIQRLLDGKCWMMDALDLGRTPLTVNLTNSNTNLSTTVTAETFNSWKKTSGVGTYTAGEFINLTGTDSTSNSAYGTLYNYYSASAGTKTDNTNSGNASYDICPAGWRLPTGGSSGEFQTLYGFYNSHTLMHASIENEGAAFTLSGNFSSSNHTPNYKGSYGYFWSSTRSSDTAMYLLRLHGDIYPSYSAARTFGFSIRCVLNQ